MAATETSTRFLGTSRTQTESSKTDNVGLMNVNLLSNQRLKQQEETLNLPAWKNTSDCDTTRHSSTANAECGFSAQN